MKNKKNELGNPEKNLIAMGAAMGAGCRTCADKLFELAVAMKISAGEMKKAFQWGLDARTEAGGTMNAKVDELLGSCCAKAACGRNPGSAPERGAAADRLRPLVRIAAFVAANSAPDAAAEIKRAAGDGIGEDEIHLSISIGKMVRKNAQAFSDEEVEGSLGGETVEAMCCPAPGASQKTGCSCS